MVIFHSYVSLPEGSSTFLNHTRSDDPRWSRKIRFWWSKYISCGQRNTALTGQRRSNNILLSRFDWTNLSKWSGWIPVIWERHRKVWSLLGLDNTKHLRHLSPEDSKNVLMIQMISIDHHQWTWGGFEHYDDLQWCPQSDERGLNTQSQGLCIAVQQSAPTSCTFGTFVFHMVWIFQMLNGEVLKGFHGQNMAHHCVVNLDIAGYSLIW